VLYGVGCWHPGPHGPLAGPGRYRPEWL